MEQIAHHLAKYMASIDFSDLSPEIVHEVKRRLLDSLGCAFGAYNSHPARAVRKIGKTLTTYKGSSLLGNDGRTSSDFAAFANGILVRYLDFNDTYLSKEPAHPSDNISAALSISEALGVGGKNLITSIVLGYEIQCRLCDAASLRAHGWDHVTYVSISSALLVSKLMGLDVEKTAHAVALAITPNITLRQTRVGSLSMWKGCASANAARNGLFAATLAREGITGPSPVFEGEKGFFRQVTGHFHLNPDNFGGKKGNYKILDTYIKYYPSEYHSQAAVEAALELRKEINVEDIKEISIETYDACVDIIAGDKEKWRPETRETADHSLPYCIAVALLDGKVGLEQFAEERYKDPYLLDLVDKVSVKRNPEHTALYPDAFPCNISIKTKSGFFTKTVNYPKGHPRNPMTDEEVENKFSVLSSELLKDAQRKEIIKSVWNLEKYTNIGDFMSLLVIDKESI